MQSKCRSVANQSIGALPPSSRLHSLMLMTTSHTPCMGSAVRGDFDCLLTYTAGCLHSGSGISSPYGASNPSSSSHANEIYRAKQFLDKYCDRGGNSGWRGTQCFLRSDIRNCESSLTSLSSGQPCA